MAKEEQEPEEKITEGWSKLGGTKRGMLTRSDSKSERAE